MMRIKACYKMCWWWSFVL